MNMEVGGQGVKIKWEKLKTPFLLMAVRATDATAATSGCVSFICVVYSHASVCVWQWLIITKKEQRPGWGMGVWGEVSVFQVSE